MVRIISASEFDEAVRNKSSKVFVVFSNGASLCNRMLEQVANTGIDTCMMYTSNRDNREIMTEFDFQRPPLTVYFEDGSYKGQWSGFMQTYAIKSHFKTEE